MACSYSGLLMPIAGEGSELLSTRYKNDTIRTHQQLISIIAYGTWGSSIYLDMEIDNQNSTPITIDFNECDLIDTYNQKWQQQGSIHTDKYQSTGKGYMVYEGVEEVEIKGIRKRLATIEPNEEKKFMIGFSYPVRDLQSSQEPVRLASDRIVKLTVPVAINHDQEPPTKTDFTFKFRYADRPRFGNLKGKRLRP